MYNVELQGENLVFSNGETKMATNDEKRYFILRKKLKAIKMLLRDKDGNEYDGWKIIRWADIHRHSGYSFLDGAIRIKDMVNKTDVCGALTDHGNMCGAVEYYKAMKAVNKLPIIGQEFYVETIGGEKCGNHLILLAKNNKGYKNLLKLSSLAYNNFYKKPHISIDMIKKYHEGLICTTACIGGEIPRFICSENFTMDGLEKIVNIYHDIFGEDYYFEIQRHGIENEDRVNSVLTGLSNRHGIKLVAAVDAHYLNKDDADAHESILCTSTRSKLTDENRMKFEGIGYHIHSADEVEGLFKDIPEALDNTLEIAEKCEGFYIEIGKYYLPKFDMPEGLTAYEYLYELADKGFNQRYSYLLTEDKGKYNSYRERFDYELGVIKKMGFEGYFLIVWDFINFAKRNDIPIGPGRGSGAGSIVLYCLQITEIDPMKYDLLFERFLNPDRISMPDIDTDIAESKRQIVIDYVSKKYGIDRVSQIITFGTFGSKSAIRDVARVYGLSTGESQKITKTIPDDPKMTINKALNESPDFVKMMNSSDLYKKILSIAKKIEGLPRNRSIHASGICISGAVMTEYLPQIVITDESTGEKVISTQYSMNDCEDVGVIKFDFLGLRTLDVIDNAGKLIERKTGKRIWEYNIPIDDPKVYAFLGKGNTDGVFQFESDGMTGLLKNMFEDANERIDTKGKAEEYFERLIAAVSLYRPGPLSEIPHYLKGMKTGIIQYDHKKLETILSKTYGVLVYQEQIMRAVRILAGFSTGQADTVRKAMGKKKVEIMDEYGKYFLNGSEAHDKANPSKAYNISGCINNGIPASSASVIWDKMVKFAEYAFNKSHAAAYATLGAKTAWLTCYYPVEYMTAMLNSYITDNKKLDRYVKICKKNNITLRKPDINMSNKQFDIDNDEIIFGISGIKGVGCVAADSIINERNQNGPFISYIDFIIRITRNSSVDSSALSALIYSGALDCFPGTRKAKIESLDLSTAAVISSVKKESILQMSLTSFLGIPDYEINLSDNDEFDEFTIAFKEEDVLGIFLKHPVEKYADKLNKWRKKNKLNYISEIDEKYNGKEVRLAGIVKEKKLSSYMEQKKYTTKHILKFTLNDGTGYVNCVMFGEEALKYNSIDTNKAVYYTLGRVKVDDFGTSVMINKINTI